jgi:hypothetical protein
MQGLSTNPIEIVPQAEKPHEFNIFAQT